MKSTVLAGQEELALTLLAVDERAVELVQWPVAEGKAPAPGSMGGGGMMGGMMGAAEPDDLRKTGPDSQVASIRHCRDTYTVRTRDGKTPTVSGNTTCGSRPIRASGDPAQERL